MRNLLLPSVVVALLLGCVSGAHAQEDPKALIQKSIKAHGGEDRLAKLNATRAKAKGTVEVMGAVLGFTSDSAAQLPDKLRNELSLDAMGQKVTVIQVFNGEKAWAWVSTVGTTQELDGASLEEMKNAAYAARVESLLPLLKDNSFSFAALPETKVNGKLAVGIRVKSASHPDINLYFDKENNLLVKTERTSLDAEMKKVLMESVYSNFKEFDGVKQPVKIVVTHNGNKFMDAEITEVKFFDKLEDSVFAKP